MLAWNKGKSQALLRTRWKRVLCFSVVARSWGLNEINMTDGNIVNSDSLLLGQSIVSPDTCVRINAFSSLLHRATPKWVVTSTVPHLRPPHMNLNSGLCLQNFFDNFVDGTLAPVNTPRSKQKDAHQEEGGDAGVQPWRSLPTWVLRDAKKAAERVDPYARVW